MKMVSIYIGNLTWWTSDYDLEQQIKKNGIADLVEIKIYENASNGQSKGYALVHLGSESSAKLLMDKFPKVLFFGFKKNILNIFLDRSKRSKANCDSGECVNASTI